MDALKLNLKDITCLLYGICTSGCEGRNFEILDQVANLNKLFLSIKELTLSVQLDVGQFQRQERVLKFQKFSSLLT